MSVCACVRACVRVCVSACACACVRVCVRARVHVRVRVCVTLSFCYNEHRLGHGYTPQHEPGITCRYVQSIENNNYALVKSG